ncbi:MAG: methionine synthase [Spirochaetae bacterium HGW-Spirochaetae-4]|nr:MAG: hypothetical protein A2Y31_08130 [Spirochaetes bacterium GWC2_52_13]PKL22732.1 MAG: methionine synthase [Spirochaetae bacterium HGW-Spirochaetae-4]HCG64028.1 methionine synthase [Sphaerochaeta sp.]HCS35639.1 methionine synthase [Sphaerochaeta sp.]
MAQKPILIDVPFSPSLSQYRRSIRFDALDDAQVEAVQLFDDATMLLQPKVLLRQLFIGSHEVVAGVPSVAIGSERFVGTAMAALDEVHRVFVYVATCGDGMESYDLKRLDMLAPYWLDSIKNQALGAARRGLLEYCTAHFGISKPLSVNPGSGNIDLWPIEQMHGLFRLLGERGAEPIGVRLTESSLMVPNKSIAGMLFASAKSDYESCAYCDREQCPQRRVPRSGETLRLTAKHPHH